MLLLLFCCPVLVLVLWFLSSDLRHHNKMHPNPTATATATAETISHSSAAAVEFEFGKRKRNNKMKEQTGASATSCPGIVRILSVLLISQRTAQAVPAPSVLVVVVVVNHQLFLIYFLSFIWQMCFGGDSAEQVEGLLPCAVAVTVSDGSWWWSYFAG